MSGRKAYTNPFVEATEYPPGDQVVFIPKYGAKFCSEHATTPEPQI